MGGNLAGTRDAGDRRVRAVHAGYEYAARRHLSAPGRARRSSSSPPPSLLAGSRPALRRRAASPTSRPRSAATLVQVAAVGARAPRRTAATSRCCAGSPSRSCSPASPSSTTRSSRRSAPRTSTSATCCASPPGSRCFAGVIERDARAASAPRAEAAVAGERRRLARELHDGVAQELAFIRRRAGRLAETPDGDRDPRRRRPRAGGLAARDRGARPARPRAAGRRAGAPRRPPGDRVRRRGAGQRARSRPTSRDEVRAELVRIISEAVRNAAHHGGARHVRVELAGTPLAVRIIDDGSGFRDGANSGLGVAGYGLIAMRERAEQVGGTVQPGIRPRRRYSRAGGAAIDQVRVLVADDHAPTREDIATALGQDGGFDDHRHGGGRARRGRRCAARAARSGAAGRQHARQRAGRGVGDHRAAARRPAS